MTYINKIKHGRKMDAIRLILIPILFFMNLSILSAETSEGFDHFSTGFPLTGKHEFIDCSSCHIGGQFKGTPLECGLCHNRSRAPGKHPQHFRSSNICDDCHTVDTWRGARFDHGDVIGTCESCHNNSVATGKSPTHILTTPACEDCHNTITFGRVGRIDHASVLGTCTSCHNGFTATGLPPQHIATNDQCDACHNTISWNNARFDHSNVTGTCSSCHNGITAIGKNPGHVQTTAECDDCHSTSTWLGAAFDHNSVTGLCLSCHNGSTATGKGSTHFVTTLDCDNCHTPTRWIPLTLFRHNSPDYPGDHRTATLCVDCHTTNNQTIAWPFTAYKPDCAGCHASDYKQDSHKKTESPETKYTVSELRDCTGSCHLYTDSSLTTIKKSRSNEHRASGGEW